MDRTSWKPKVYKATESVDYKVNEVNIERGNSSMKIDGKNIIKIWESFSGWYWYAIEDQGSYTGIGADGNEVQAHAWYGYVQGMENEWGTWDSNELERAGVWTVPKSNWGWTGKESKASENWKDVADKFYKEELNKDKKSAGESKLKAGYAQCPHCSTQMNRLDWLQDHIKTSHPTKASEGQLMKIEKNGWEFSVIDNGYGGDYAGGTKDVGLLEVAIFEPEIDPILGSQKSEIKGWMTQEDVEDLKRTFETDPVMAYRRIGGEWKESWQKGGESYFVEWGYDLDYDFAEIDDIDDAKQKAESEGGNVYLNDKLVYSVIPSIKKDPTNDKSSFTVANNLMGVEAKASEYDCESCGGDYSNCPHCGHGMHDYEWENSNDVCDSCEKGKYDESKSNEGMLQAKCFSCDNTFKTVDGSKPENCPKCGSDMIAYSEESLANEEIIPDWNYHADDNDSDEEPYDDSDDLYELMRDQQRDEEEKTKNESYASENERDEARNWWDYLPYDERESLARDNGGSFDMSKFDYQYEGSKFDITKIFNELILDKQGISGINTVELTRNSGLFDNDYWTEDSGGVKPKGEYYESKASEGLAEDVLYEWKNEYVLPLRDPALMGTSMTEYQVYYDGWKTFAMGKGLTQVEINELWDRANPLMTESKASEGFYQGLHGYVDAKCKTCGIEFDSIPDMDDHYAMNSDHISNLDDLDNDIPNSD